VTETGRLILFAYCSIHAEASNTCVFCGMFALPWIASSEAAHCLSKDARAKIESWQEFHSDDFIE
jgi:hypothetical protein